MNHDPWQYENEMNIFKPIRQSDNWEEWGLNFCFLDLSFLQIIKSEIVFFQNQH